MTEKEVVITYETLFELLRLEKNREDLQKLEPRFFDDVLQYLNDKKDSFEQKDGQSQLFTVGEKDKTRLELENIRKIIKELYDRREKKIIKTALDKARTGVVLINTANMLPTEKLLFNTMNKALSEFRKSILFKVACGEKPAVDDLIDRLSNVIREVALEPAGNSPIKLSGAENALNNDKSSESSISRVLEPSSIAAESSFSGAQSCKIPSGHPEEPKELKSPQNSSDLRVGNKKIRFLTAINEVVGPDLQIYGPYEEGQAVSLPAALAQVLLEKGQAQEVRN